MTKEKKDFYYSIAQSYANYGNNAITDWVLGFANVFKCLQSVSGKTILDYGCGTGKFSRFLRDNGAKVIGVDVSKKMLDEAEAQDVTNINYHHIVDADLSFMEDNSVDDAVLCFVLCILNKKTEMLKILQEVYRAVKHGGRIVLLSVNWEKSQGKEFISFKLDEVEVEDLTPGKQLEVTLKGDPLIKVKKCFWPISFYKDLLIEAGFSIECVEEPIIAENDDRYEWLDEKTSEPFSIIVARK